MSDREKLITEIAALIEAGGDSVRIAEQVLAAVERAVPDYLAKPGLIRCKNNVVHGGSWIDNHAYD